MVSKSRNYWTKEKVFEVARKCSTKKQFKNLYGGAYSKAYNKGWLNEMNWFPSFKECNGYCVYAYIDELSYSVYVGLTIDMDRRDKEHRNTITSVSTHFTTIPQPQILISGISQKQAQYWENWYKVEFQIQGYNVLNKGKTGVGVGSLGGFGKWTKELVYEESKKFTTLYDFSRQRSQAYTIALKNGWLNEMIWLERKCKRWNKEEVFEESKKYISKKDFENGCRTAYTLAYKNKWFSEMEWLKPKKKAVKWTKEKVFEEMCKYKNITQFKKNCSRGYVVAKENGYLTFYTDKQ